MIMQFMSAEGNNKKLVPSEPGKGNNKKLVPSEPKERETIKNWCPFKVYSHSLLSSPVMARFALVSAHNFHQINNKTHSDCYVGQQCSRRHPRATMFLRGDNPL